MGIFLFYSLLYFYWVRKPYASGLLRGWGILRDEFKLTAILNNMDLTDH